MDDFASHSLSAVDQAVISNALIAAANEMGVKLIRSAHSPILREAEDCATAILDADGKVVTQSELIPIQLGSISHTFGPCAEACPPSELVEGDFYITNHPYHGGQHLPDIFIYTPVFYGGALIGFTASVAHHLDIGGGAPGLNMNATDVYQEGLLFPPSRYNLARDWNGGSFERLVRANARTPDLIAGDFNAQFAGNAIGAARLRDLCDKFGIGKIRTAMGELQDYSERRIRAAIAEAPDGVYEGEDWLDDDGLGSGPIPIRAKVTISGSDISVDYGGTGGQLKSILNCPVASTVGAASVCIKSVLTPTDIPYNDGCERVIKVTVPYGSLLNPMPPAPVRARMGPSYRAYNAVMKALAQAVPDKVIAAGFDTTMNCVFSHLENGKYSIYLEVFGGGYGAGLGSDGCDGVDSPLSNCRNIPIEAMDMTYDFFRLIDYSLLPGSGGAGQYRGGLGYQRIYEILKDDVTFASYADRFTLSPEGLFGGEQGRTAQSFVERDGERIALKSKESFMLRKGDRLIMHTGGGAGYGPVDDRAADALARDLADGLMASQ